MKKILLVLILVISLTLSSCDIFLTNPDGSDSNSSNSGGSKPENDSNIGDSENGDSDKPNDSGNNGSSDDNGDDENSSGDNSDDSTSSGTGNSGTGNAGGGSTGSSGSVEQTKHSDADNNGVCDVCNVSVLVELDFYALNDLHGKFTDGSGQPGVDELTTYFKNAYSDNDNVFLIASGDMWQGGSESNLTKGLIVTDWMNELDFVSMTLGNHEFDWGEQYIESNADFAEFPLLAINVFSTETNQRVDYAEASLLIEQNGVKIGIIGAIGDCYSSISADKVENVYFKVGNELTSLVKAESEKLRSEGADIIVYSLHDGYGSSGGSVITDSKLSSYYDPILSKDKYVDIVFEGHTHQNYVLKDAYGVYHIQNGGDNKAIAHAEIMFNYVTDKYTVSESEVVSNSVYSMLSSDPLVDELLKKYSEEIELGDEIIGNNARKRYSSELNQLVADLYLEAGLEKWGSEYNIFLGGGFIKARSPYNLSAGAVRYSDLLMIYPFDNEISLCSIKGRYLKSKFINTANTDYYISKSDYGSSVSTINDNSTYYVIVDSYTAVYAPNNLTVVETYDTTTFARDLLKEYIKDGGLNK